MKDHKGIAIKFLVLFLLCMVCNIQFVSGGGVGELRCIEREREALLRFKKGLIDEYGILLSWGSEDDKKECCKWMGVNCSNTTGHVIGFGLSRGLRGKISPALLELHHLKNLDLSHNDFGGDRIPEFIGSIKNLEILNLQDSSFSGIVPPQLGNLTNLRNLDLSDNMLEGEIPNSLGNLSHLQILSLFHNHLGGDLEELFGAKGMVSLESLDLSYNQLTGSVPDLGACTALKKLYLGSNNFTGSVPVSIGQLSELEVLDLSFNSLEGTISESNFIKLPNLKVLDLSFNSFTLQISPDWSPPFQLNVINLANCNMGSHFPKWIQTQSNFSLLDLSCAGISDELPKWLWSLVPSLHYLNISHNQISGTIPDFSSTFIYMIDVSSNKISGPIPLIHPDTSMVQFSQNIFSGSISSLCTIPHSGLILFDLSNNQLAGELPDCWEKMTNLESLNLANNSFSGEIPRTLGSLHGLYMLHLGDNNFSGVLPSTLKNIQQLKLIDIGGNKLTGNIPAWIGANYPHMAYLSLRQNRFYGNIPPEICNLTQIQILDLSENNLSGNIPECFNNFISLVEKNTTTFPAMEFNIDIDSNIQFSRGGLVREYIEYGLVQWKGKESEYRETLLLLKLIDLSSNKLVGSIPGSFSRMKGLISLNLSRNSLTGNIIPDIGQMEMLECLDLSRNQLSGEIPTGLAQLNFLAVLDSANNYLTGKIPQSTQLQGFNASVYAENSGLCGRPLTLCPGDGLSPPINNQGEDIKGKDDGFMSLSFMQEFGISMAFGFIVGFWGVVGSLLLKRSWRIAYFNFLDAIGDWLYVTTTIFCTKFKRS